jgi:energy-coupling factor transport system permease protein
VTRAVRGYLVDGTSWLHRRHPLTKLLGVLFVVVAAFLLPAPALIPLGAALVAIVASAGLTGALLRSFRIPAGLLLSVVFLNALLFPGGRDVLVSLGPLAVTLEGLTFGLVSAGRLIVVFIAAIAFLSTTLPDDLLEGLVARGVSHRIAFVVLSAVQLVPRMQDRAGRILEAQAARGLAVDGSFRTRVRAIIPVIGPVILGALVDVRERTLALEARGFGARPGRTAYRVVPDPEVDRAIRAGLLVAIGLVVIATLVGVGR